MVVTIVLTLIFTLIITIIHTRCYETYDEGQEFFIVTELVAGGELFDRIVAKTHYTEKEARDLVRTFLETMAYMHESGVVHRDLKPENLLLCSGKYVIYLCVLLECTVKCGA